MAMPMATTIPFPLRSAAHRADLDRPAPAPSLFPLLRWFALLSAAAILFVSITGTLFLGRFLERASLLQSADAFAQLVGSIVDVEGAESFFLEGGRNGSDRGSAEFLVHLGRLPGVLRANLYGLDGTVLWSTDPSLVGKRFAKNDELHLALAGTPVASVGSIGDVGEKAEHARLTLAGRRFVENYLPIWSSGAAERRVIGAIEMYRQPVSLLDAIATTQRQIWWGALGVTGLLYAALFGIVARAACILRRQHRALLAAEKLAAVGEMASAVAHGLRNPLASIRSTAELGLDCDDVREARELHAEVVTQSDRLESWIRQFLIAARVGPPASAATAAGDAIADCSAQFAPALARREVTLAASVPDGLPQVAVCPVILRQVLASLLANAAEATADGGRLSITAAATDLAVTIEIGDDGPGMSDAEIRAAFEPFATTKPAGLGLGLPLAREALERHGGRLAVVSRPGVGTVARLVLPAAATRARERGA